MSKQDNPQIIIKTQVYWAHLLKPNDLSGKFQVDLAKLSPENQAKLKEFGLTLRQDQDKVKDDGTVIPQERDIYITAKKGPDYPPKIVGPDNKPWDPNIEIGNGSVCSVAVRPYPWEHKPTGRKGVSLGLNMIRVEEFKEAPKKSVEDVFGEAVGAPVTAAVAESVAVEDTPFDVKQDFDDFEAVK